MAARRRTIQQTPFSQAPPRSSGAPGSGSHTQPTERQLREERILDAAATLLVRWGYRKTTIDDVAREAGVGKGTIYLHWKDKNELFGATLRRASYRLIDYTLRQIAADPDGGLPHRLWTHSMLAAFTDPLMAAVMRGQSDILQGLINVFPAAALQQMAGDYEEYIVQLQGAGLIRADLPVSIITYLTSALKIGLINTPDMLGSQDTMNVEQLTEALSDLIRRWLEPDQPPRDTEAGKRFLVEWLAKLKAVEEQLL
jgi:AcrR family transcriptional regulator